ncbi:MAG: Signal transduction histidine-protein kinase BarA [Deltaproteobacteria bacterium ADurb.Bin510]|nr:MAG: Signal transduction histidine-protein kinase BarA [Deltaproteobacteria bacterium ADurb.Bin510]
MPGMDGLAATRAIREREKGQPHHTVIIAMTAHAMKGDSDKCLAAGMDGYLAKPIEPDQLERELKRWLGETLQDEPEHLDLDGLLQRMGGDEGLARRVMTVFVQSVPAQLRALGEACARRDAELVHQIGHTIKGAAASTGAVRLSELAFEVELAGQQADLARAGELSTRLAEEFQALEPLVRAQLDGG